MSDDALTVSQQIRLEAARMIGTNRDVRDILELAHVIEHGELRPKKAPLIPMPPKQDPK